MAAFTAKGVLAEWRLIYELIREMSVDEILRYEALDELLGRSFTEEGSKRNPLERARRELETIDHRTLEVVKGIGYRVAAPQRHIGLAAVHHRKSRRQVTKAKQKLDSTNLSALSPEERERWEAMQLLTSHNLSQQRHMARQIAGLERALDQVRNGQR